MRRSALGCLGDIGLMLAVGVPAGACHPGADRGEYDDDTVRLPR